MGESTTYVGLDAHKKTIQVAMLLPGRNDPLEWQVVNEGAAVRRMAKRIQKEAARHVRVCYEAGPCGYSLQRTLQDLGMECVVVAPSLIPVNRLGVGLGRSELVKTAMFARAPLRTHADPWVRGLGSCARREAL